MFERRVKVVLVFLVLLAVGLLARAMQVQIAQAAHWEAVAGEALRRSTLTEATRGRILDAKGRVLAQDIPCNDAAVAYWFITEKPDEDRLYDLARQLARTRPDYAGMSRDEQHELVLTFLPAASQKLEDMWNILADVGDVPRSEIDAIRREIVDKVERRRRMIVMSRYLASQKEHEEKGLSPWWQRWVLGEADAPPELEEFEEPIAEELQAHVVLAGLSTEAYNELRKRIDELPGLSLLASTKRYYPEGPATAHLVGFLDPVTIDDLKADPEVKDEQRAYLQRDLIGRTGLEAIGERTLRGTRGRIDYDLELREETVRIEHEPGQDLQSTIDVELQKAVRDAFLHVDFKWPAEGYEKVLEAGAFPGAAVVLSVKDSSVLALASYPDYDPNAYKENYSTLRQDYLNRPLINRATQFATVAGSTVKPIVGIAAIMEGVLHPHETIECDGYFHLNGRPLLTYLRCWTASMYDGALNGHQEGDPHPAEGLNPGFDPPPGHLTLADAIQRSCNVFFETAAMRLGEQRLTKWMRAFGLGSPTGIGLPEQKGLLLDSLDDKTRSSGNMLISYLLPAGIGQGHVQATPLQMANVAATLAREGVFIPPSITQEQTRAALRQKRDLKISPGALDMVRRGMAAAVQRRGGSGHGIDGQLPVPIAGKTGSAQAHRLKVPLLDADGKPRLDERGNIRWVEVELSTYGNPNPQAPWYRRANRDSADKASVSHSWFIGYAPADNPQVAFAVMVEYGGSGGDSAGSVVVDIIHALVELGYLEPTRQLDSSAPPGEVRYVP